MRDSFEVCIFKHNIAGAFKLEWDSNLYEGVFIIWEGVYRANIFSIGHGKSYIANRCFVNITYYWI